MISSSYWIYRLTPYQEKQPHAQPDDGHARYLGKKVLLRISAQVEQGENPAELTFYEVVQEPDGHYLRFMKAIDTKPMCLACHGAA